MGNKFLWLTLLYLPILLIGIVYILIKETLSVLGKLVITFLLFLLQGYIEELEKFDFWKNVYNSVTKNKHENENN